MINDILEACLIKKMESKVLASERNIQSYFIYVYF